jgi:hypothetical protein
VEERNKDALNPNAREKPNTKSGRRLLGDVVVNE